MKKSGAVSAVLFSLLLWSCGGDDASPTTPTTTPKPTPVATSVTLSVTSLSLASLGVTSQLSATVKDQNGATMSGASVSWSSSSASVATVSSSGLVTSVADGTATITATSGSASATASASIQQVAVSITLSPDSLVFASAGDTATVTATVLDAGGSDIPSPSLTWSSSDESTVTVSSAGVVTAVASGPANVKAQTGDQEAEISARVKGSYLAVTVTGDGDPLPDVEVWLTDPTGTNTKKTTDAAGTVLYRNLEAGEHTVTLQQVPTGLTLTPASPQNVQVAEDQGHDLVFTGIFSPAQITGTAKSWGQPVEGALVRIEGKDTAEVTVNAAGVFQVDSVRRGEYTLTISNHSGVRFKETTLTQTLESGANTPEFIGRPDSEVTWASVAVGTNWTCGVTTASEAYCWGYNGNGQLADGTTTDRTTPVLVTGGHSWASVSADNSHTCGVTTAGEAYCWGYNGTGELGDGTVTDRHEPVLVGGGHSWASVSAGTSHTCGVTTAGEAYCWGRNLYGRLGDGTTTDSSVPVLVSGGHSWASVDGGTLSTCGVTTTGEGYCWGSNGNGQLGIGTEDSRRTVPTLVSGGHTWASVTLGGTHTCGVTTAGEAYCWGENGTGELGDGTTTDSSVPVLVSGGRTWASVSAGGPHTCGVTTFGEAYCWGYNGEGGFGDGTTTDSTIPTLVSGGHSWASVSGRDHRCGVTTEGEAYCWGGNKYGELGNGTTTNSLVPVKVGGNW
jgi:alpha-tubulin suppressor-like RCC1 family protein